MSMTAMLFRFNADPVFTISVSKTLLRHASNSFRHQSVIQLRFLVKILEPTKEYNVDYDFQTSVLAYVFKTIVDPFIGRYSLVKVCSGELKADSVIYNYERETEEKLSRLYVLGKKRSKYLSLKPVISVPLPN